VYGVVTHGGALYSVAGAISARYSRHVSVNWPIALSGSQDSADMASVCGQKFSSYKG
jgi:hypothetical protein